MANLWYSNVQTLPFVIHIHICIYVCQYVTYRIPYRDNMHENLGVYPCFSHILISCSPSLSHWHAINKTFRGVFFLELHKACIISGQLHLGAGLRARGRSYTAWGVFILPIPHWIVTMNKSGVTMPRGNYLCRRSLRLWACPEF